MLREIISRRFFYVCIFAAAPLTRFVHAQARPHWQQIHEENKLYFQPLTIKGMCEASVRTSKYHSTRSAIEQEVAQRRDATSIGGGFLHRQAIANDRGEHQHMGAQGVEARQRKSILQRLC